MIFIDTEFTFLPQERGTQAPSPISLAMVSESGESLYIVLTEGWAEADCNGFVIETVLPLLPLHAPQKLGRLDAGRAIGFYLQTQFQASQSDRLDIVSDWAGDWGFFAELLVDAGVRPAPVQTHIANHLLNRYERMQFDILQSGYWLAHGAEQHHALVDAHCLRQCFLAAKAG